MADSRAKSVAQFDLAVTVHMGLEQVHVYVFGRFSCEECGAARITSPRQYKDIDARLRVRLYGGFSCELRSSRRFPDRLVPVYVYQECFRIR